MSMPLMVLAQKSNTELVGDVTVQVVNSKSPVSVSLCTGGGVPVQ